MGWCLLGKVLSRARAVIPKLLEPHKPECHYVGRPDSTLTDSSWYVTQSQHERKKRASQKSSAPRTCWGFFGPVLTATCHKQCKDDVVVLFPKVLLLSTNSWLCQAKWGTCLLLALFLFFPSPFPPYKPDVQPKGAPSFPTPQHWCAAFPHLVPLEAEEANQSFALDFL